MIWRASLLALGLSCCACAETTPTQVLVQLHVDADLALIATSAKVTIVNDEAVEVLDKELVLDGTPGRIARIPMVPKGGDPSRRYIVRAELSDGTNVLGRIEARSGYAEGELRTLNLWFTSSCQSKLDCTEGKTCDRGVCRGSCYATSSADATAPSHPSCKECQKCLVSCEATPDADCGCSGDKCVGSECDPKNKFRFVGAGRTHSCAALKNGDLYCWGTSTLGTNPTPTAVTGVIANSGVSLGASHGCALSEAPASYTCWGPNTLGQLGGVPDAVSGLAVGTNPSDPFRSLDAGFDHTCALGLYGSLWCWGANDQGQIGNGTLENALTPSQVPGEYLQIASGGKHSCALEAGGKLVCWGNNHALQAGGSMRGAIVTPIEPGCDDPSSPTCFHDWSYVGAGGWITCAIRTGNELYCWGANVQGERGTGPPYESSEVSDPMRVGKGIAWAQVDGGFRHTCGIDTHGRLYCWGYNEHRETGAGTEKRIPTPMRVDSAGGFASVALGENHTCAIRDDDSLWCWGSNAEGQLGTGAPSTTPVATPTRVCF